MSEKLPDALSTEGPTEPEPAVLEYSFMDFFNFLREQKEEHKPLQMLCAFKGTPLPYTHFDLNSSLGWDGKIEFSTQLGMAFIQYMGKKKSVGSFHDRPARYPNDK